MNSKRIMSGVLAALMVIAPIEVKAEEIKYTNYQFTDMDNIVVSIPDTIGLTYDSLDKSFKGQNKIIVSGGEGYTVEISVESTNIRYRHEDDNSLMANGIINFGEKGVEAWSEEEISASTGKDISVVVSQFPQNTIGTYKSNINYNINISENVKLENDKYFTKTVNKDDMTCVITGFTNIGLEWMMSETEDKGAKELVIPETLVVDGKKYTVKAIDNNSFSTSGKFLDNYGTENEAYKSYYQISSDYRIKKLVIPSTVKSIGQSAFNKNDQLEEVSLADGLETIGNNAFEYCSSLKSVTIPDSVTSAGSYAFSSCKSLVSATLSKNMTETSNGLFLHCSSLANVEIPNNITKIGQNSFGYCSSLEHVEIPSAVTDIGISAFDSCTSLKEVEIPDSVVTIQNYVFARCKSLSSVKLSQKTTSIGNGAFMTCEALTQIDIPNTVTNIGSSAFDGCKSLESAVVPDSVRNLGSSAFANCSKLTTITLSNNISQINDSVFDGCSSLTGITIPKNVTSIGKNAFKGCASFKEIVIPDNVKSIGNSAFSNCTNMTGITLSNNIDKLSNGLFSYCSSLSSIVIPDNVKSVETNAFYYCTSLKSITIPDKVTYIGDSVFAFSGLTEISLPNTVLKIDRSSFYRLNDFRTVYYRGTEDEKNSNLTVDNYNNYNQLLLDAEWFYVGTRAAIVSDDGYFTLATDSNASSCDITGLTNEGKEWMESETFTVATESNAIATSSNATVSGGDAEPEQEYIEKTGVLIIPETLYVDEEEYGVTTIKSEAFTDNENLAVVLIPNMELSIEENAFGNDIAISDVYFEGTREEKDTNIYIAENNESLINASWHCIDDEEEIEEKIEYTVTFLDEDESTEISILNIVEDNIIEASDIPEHTKEETELATYEFIGWFLQNEDGTLADAAFDFETPITQDITLVAQFEETLKETEEDRESTEITDETEPVEDTTIEDGNTEEETGETQEETEGETEENTNETEQETEENSDETEQEIEESTDNEENTSEEEAVEEEATQSDVEQISDENVSLEIEEDAIPIEDDKKDTVSGNDMVMYKEENKEEKEEE